MIEDISDLKEVVRLQLVFRSLNRRLKNTDLYEPEPVFLESNLYSLLSRGGPKTLSEIAEMMGIDTTEAYYLLSSLKLRKMVAALPGNPIKFITIKKAYSKFSR